MSEYDSYGTILRTFIQNRSKQILTKLDAVTNITHNKKEKYKDMRYD